MDEARIEVVRRHMSLEITHDWDGVIGTFDHPRYELLGPGTVFDGEAAVRSYFAASRESLPDHASEVIAIAADAMTDTVHFEFWLTDTHLGPLKLGRRTIAPTGTAFRIRMAASFDCPGQRQDHLRTPLLRPVGSNEGARPLLKRRCKLKPTPIPR